MRPKSTPLFCISPQDFAANIKPISGGAYRIHSQNPADVPSADPQ